MLSEIFGGKSEHPLASIKSAQALLKNLPKNDAYMSLMELTEWIESAAEQNDFKLDHQFAVISLIDEAAQSYVRKLVREYFTPFEINKFQENRLWLLLNNFSRHAAEAYYTVFNRYCNAEKGSIALKPQLPLLAARAVYAHISQLKFVCSRYGQVDSSIWANLARLYKHAEQLLYLDTPVNLYPGLTGNTTLKCELGHVLVWYDSGLSSLSHVYIHLTERIVAQYCSSVDIHSEISGNSRIFFDLNNPAEASRINMDATTHPAMRFISMPTMQARVEELMKVLKKNIVPEDLNLDGNFDAEVVMKAAQHLLNYLIAPPVRRSERRSANVTLNVVNSFEKVLDSSNTVQQFTHEKPARWVTEEISVGGFSSVLPKGSDGIGIGSLLGIQPDGMSHWGVAVVRRLLRDEHKNMHAGAEILAIQVAAVSLNLNGKNSGDAQRALWLYPKPGQASGGDQLLLMGIDTYSPNRSLKIELDGKHYLLIPGGLQEKGLDYDLAKFKLIEQEFETDEGS